ncbi:hypothetical protein DXG01_013427 [Tephrocybe rancida]|nr:hypothetical protein DXG01_013427 [Tephrocybe rancida]
MAASCLPPELWVLILDYLEREDLKQLIGVNRLIRGLCLDELCRVVELKQDALHYMKALSALQSPEVAAGVRILKISPVATWDVITWRPAMPPRPSLLSRLTGHVNPTATPQPTTPRELSLRSTQEEKRLAVIRAARNLVNVRSLRVSGRHWNPDSERALYHPWCPLLATLLPIVADRLHTISFNMPPSVIDTFISSFNIPLLPSLQELGLDTTLPSDVTIADTPNFIAFLNNYSSTLRSLSVIMEYEDSPALLAFDAHTVTHLNFFNNFGDFPHLTKLFLVILSNRRNLTIPQSTGLGRLLRRHGLLQDRLGGGPFRQKFHSSTLSWQQSS